MIEETFAGIGTLRIYQYQEINEEYSAKKCIGANLIMSFKGDNNFGEEGGIISFVQMVTDDFHYDSKGKTVWAYQHAGQEALVAKKCVIDQKFEYKINDDVRYTEQRMCSSGASVCTQEEKVEKFVNLTKAEAQKMGIKLEEKFFDKGPEERRKEILDRLYSDTNPLPDIVYSAVKKRGVWGIARFSDEPTATYPKDSTSVEGGNIFENVVVYSKSAVDTVLYPICIVRWGWRYLDGKATKEKYLVDSNPNTENFKDILDKFKKEITVWKIVTGVDFTIEKIESLTK